ncbi:hypothetical protein SAMN02910368_01133 [Lachnospiraceae bacterium G11]|nr:hypothetical protein SAMN02910368_01133 [Lachnospiraceae bacterium G11]
MLKNKRVVKALTIGLATVLATPSMTAFAAEPVTDDNIADVTVDVKEPVAVESENSDEIADAKVAAGQAQVAEQAAYDEAVKDIKPGDGLHDVALTDIALNERDEITQEVVGVDFVGPFIVPVTVEPDDSAYEFDGAAKKELEGAEKDLSDGKAKVEADLATLDEKLNSADEKISEANTASALAAGDLITVDEALKNAQSATTSEAAAAQAGIAKTASEDADAQAKEADTKAKAAYDLYEEADKALDKAKADAKAANDAADAKVAAGAADAQKAVENAKEAERVALGLEKEMKAYRDEAKEWSGFYETELGKAQEKLSDLRGTRDTLKGEYEDKKEEYIGAYSYWEQMSNALGNAQKELKKAPSENDIRELDNKVTNLQKELKRAEEALQGLKDIRDGKQTAYDNIEDPEAAARNLVNAIQADNALTDKEKVAGVDISEAKEDALVKDNAGKVEVTDEEMALAKSARDLILEAYNDAVAKEAEASGKIIKLDGEIKTLKDTYGNDIGDLQEDILSEETTEEAEATRAQAVSDLIGRVAGSDVQLVIGEVLSEEFPNGLYTTADGKFYTYVVGEDNVISIVSYTKEEIKGMVPEIKKAVSETYSEDEYEAFIATLVANNETYIITEVDPTITPTQVGTGRYNVTYTATKEVPTGKTITVQRGEETKYDREGYVGYIKVNGRRYEARYTNALIWRNNKRVWESDWMVNGYLLCEYEGGDYLRTLINVTNVKETKTVEENKKVENLSYEEAQAYAGKQNYTATEIMEDSTKVTKNYKITYNLLKSADNISQEAYEELINQIGEEREYYTITTPGEKTTVTTTEVDVITERGKDHTLNIGDASGAPELDENGDYKYLCEITIGWHVYSTANGDLRWNSDTNRWEINYLDSWNNRKGFDSIYVYYDKSGKHGYYWESTIPTHRIHQYSDAKVERMSEEDAAKVTKCVAKIVRTTSKEIDTTTYTVYYLKEEETEKTTGYKYNKGDSEDIANLAKKNTECGLAEDLQSRAQNIINLKSAYDTQLSNYLSARAIAKGELDTANTDVTNAETALNNKNYSKLISDAQQAASNAKQTRQNALEKVSEYSSKENIAYWTAWGKYKAMEFAYQRYDGAQSDVDNQKAVVGRLSGELNSWTATYNKYKKNAEIAERLATKATEARVASENAKLAFERIANSNLGAAAIAEADARVKATWEAYLLARAAADQARKDADEAASEYQQILARVQALIDAENAAAGAGEGEGAGAGETTTGGAVVLATIPTGEEVPGAPAAPVAGGAGVAANVAPAAEATSVDIAPQNSALAATVPEDNKSDDGLATILPQGPALAADIADTEHLTWWWLLVVAVLGGTGYAMYKKFQTKKEEKVTK